MKKCPNCQELNGESLTHCWKCHTFLGTQGYKKICPKCGQIYSANASFCDGYGSKLGVYSGQSSPSGSSESSTWMYIVTILIPIVGIILGCIYIGKNEKELGKSLIITAIVTYVVYAVLLIAVTSCMASY